MMAEISSKAVNKLVYNFKYDLPDFPAIPQRFNGCGVHLKKGFTHLGSYLPMTAPYTLIF